MSVTQAYVDSVGNALRVCRDASTILDARIRTICENSFPTWQRVDGWEFDNDMLAIHEGHVSVIVSRYYGGGDDREYLRFPAEWLWLDVDVVVRQIREKLKADNAAAQAAKKHKESVAKAQAKTARHRQFETLRQEFEPDFHKGKS